MITFPEFARLLTIEHNIIHSHTQGLSQADTLIQPRPSGNCMNWVLGHLLENQISMLEVLGGTSPFPTSELEIYKRGSAHLDGSEMGVLSLERLLEGLDAVQSALLQQLGQMSEEDLSKEFRQGERVMTVGWRVFFLNFHHTFHLGQLELLRQMAGKMEPLI